MPLMYGYGYDTYTLLFLIPGILLSLWAQFKVNSTFTKYSQIAAAKGYTGAQVARQLLNECGLNDVMVEPAQGRLTDHYDPKNRVLRLSQGVYDSPSIAALGVAAHEAGHAMQDQENYSAFSMRSKIVPVASIGSRAAMPLVILGLIFSSGFFLNLGIIAFALTVIFYLVTLPVEFNASSRALAALESGGYLDYNESRDAKKVLSAAAMTYLASALVAVLQLFRLLMISGDNRRRG